MFMRLKLTKFIEPNFDLAFKGFKVEILIFENFHWPKKSSDNLKKIYTLNMGMRKT